ncbi:hypothetical protein BJ166DRAFT_246542 [Pestalotiopsis sp. NC0098]|nr:hypothetical protein BJ166DRAFT_246542 [Pestalotiopsis sp. NC0098]
MTWAITYAFLTRFLHVLLSLSTQPSFAFSRARGEKAGVADLSTSERSFQIVPDYVTRHAPLVRLHSQDPFRPSDIAQHVQHTTPMVKMANVAGLPELDLDNLDLLNVISKGADKVALTAIDDIIDLPDWLKGETPDEMGVLHNSTACVVILVGPEKDSSDFDAFYFYFYSYNRGPNITQVLAPIKGLIEDSLEDGVHFGRSRWGLGV